MKTKDLALVIVMAVFAAIVAAGLFYRKWAGREFDPAAYGWKCHSAQVNLYGDDGDPLRTVRRICFKDARR